MRILRLSAVVMLAAVVILTATPASAQYARRERPYRGLFGGGYGNSEQMLSLNVSFGGGYDSNVILGSTNDPSLSGNPLQYAGSTTGNAAGSLSYTFSRKKFAINASGFTSGAYYPDLPKTFYASSAASGGGGFQLSSHTHASFNQTYLHAPYSLQSALWGYNNPAAAAPYVASPSTIGDSLEQHPGAPADISPAPIEVSSQNGVASENQTTLNTMVSLAQQLNRRIAATLGYNYTSFSSPSHISDMQHHGLTGYISVQLAKGLAVQLGYGFTQAEYGDGAAPGARSSNIIANLDYSRALSVSLSRKTTLSFGMGTAIVSDVPVAGVSGTQSDHHFFVTGHATLNREIGRSWSAALIFNQNVSFVYAIQQPTLTDTLTGSFGGLISRQVQFHSSGGVSQGSAVTSLGSHYRTYFSGAGVQFALSRTMALGIDYSFTRYAFDNGFILPFDLSRNESRHSVIASFSLFEPLFNRTRRPDATR